MSGRIRAWFWDGDSPRSLVHGPQRPCARTVSALTATRIILAVCLLVVGGFANAGGLVAVPGLVEPASTRAGVLITSATMVGLALLADPRRASSVPSPRGGAALGVVAFWVASGAGSAPAAFMLAYFALALGGSPDAPWLALVAGMLLGPALFAGIAAIVMSGRFRHARWAIRALIPPAVWLATQGLVAGFARLTA